MDSVILLAGDDDLLLQRALQRQLAAITAALDDVDVDLHDVSETDHLPELRTTSLFGGQTCVVLRGVEGLAGDLKAEVEAYLESPAPDAVLVLVARGVGRIQKIAKLVAANGRREDVKRPPDHDDRAWDRLVTDEFAHRGRTPDASAVAAIRLHAGTDTATIAAQVATVCASVVGSQVTVADVEAAVEGRGRVSGFAIADAVADRDPGAAILAVRGALEAGEAPLAIVGALTFRFRQLLQVRSGADARTAGMSPGQHRRLQQLSARFSPGELAWCHDRLADLDLELKGSDLPDDVVLEVAIIDLATSRTVGAPFNPLVAR